MKKGLKGLLASIALSFALLLSGCGVSQGYADKINEAYEAGTSITYAEVYEDLGAPTIKAGTAGEYASGILIWVKGCENSEEVKAKNEAGEKLQALYVTFAFGKAISAEYKDYSEEAK